MGAKEISRQSGYGGTPHNILNVNLPCLKAKKKEKKKKKKGQRAKNSGRVDNNVSNNHSTKYNYGVLLDIRG